jgi:drug/metabolite transporter (DMT)-like permease
MTPVAGAILVAAGVLLVVRPPSYTSDESVFKLGTIEATMQQEHPVPAWVGGVAVGAGIVLAVIGLRRRP